VKFRARQPVRYPGRKPRVRGKTATIGLVPHTPILQIRHRKPRNKRKPRYCVLRAEGHLNRRRFGAILVRIATLLPAPQNEKLLLKVADRRDGCTIAVVFLRTATGFRSPSHQPELHHCLRSSRWVADSGIGGSSEGWPQPDHPNFRGWRLEVESDASRVAALPSGTSVSSLRECRFK